MGYLFLIFDLILLGIVGIFSFQKKVNFYNKWIFVVLAVIFTVPVFSMFDILLTTFEIWNYNFFKTIGTRNIKIPLEMVLYYVFLSFGFLVAFEFIKTFFTKKLSVRWSNFISIVLFIVFSFITLMSFGELYTSLVSLLLSVFIFQFLLFVPKWLPTFYTTFAFCLIPFFIIEILRVSMDVIIYNNIEKHGPELLNVPLENLFYIFLFCLINVFFYHLFMPRKLKRYAHINLKDPEVLSEENNPEKSE